MTSILDQDERQNGNTIFPEPTSWSDEARRDWQAIINVFYIDGTFAVFVGKHIEWFNATHIRFIDIKTGQKIDASSNVQSILVGFRKHRRLTAFPVYT